MTSKMHRLLESIPTAALVCMLIAATSTRVGAQCEPEPLVPDEPTDTRFYGFGIDAEMDWAVVGDYSDPVGGAAYIFRFGGDAWEQHQKLTLEYPGPGDRFGWEVAIKDDIIAVGAPGDGPGRAYIFRRSSELWSQEEELPSPDGGSHDHFGSALASDGNVAVVGAYGNDSEGTSAGAAYVFRRVFEIWGHEQKLTASDAEPQDVFGTAVAVSGDWALVSAPGDDGATGSVYAYRYRLDGEPTGLPLWLEEDNFSASDGNPGDRFGESMALDGDTVVIGAPNGNGSGEISGAAYVFRREGLTWVEEQKLSPGDGAGTDHFGQSVAISGDLIAVGAPGDAEVLENTGIVYVFRRGAGTWLQIGMFTADRGTEGDAFGRSTAIETDRLLVGAPSFYDLKWFEGAVFSFPLQPPCVALFGDLDGDGTVGFGDLLILLQSWGDCPAPPAPCVADLDADGSVGLADLLLLLAAWT